MNDSIRLRGKFISEPYHASKMEKSLRKNRLSKEHVEELKDDLTQYLIDWDHNTKILPIEKCLISCQYFDIVPKSRRIQELLHIKGEKKLYGKVVGAKFIHDDKRTKHIITYYVERKSIENTIEELNVLIDFFDFLNTDGISDKSFKQIQDFVKSEKPQMNEDRIIKLLIDCSNSERFFIPKPERGRQGKDLLVTFFKTEMSIRNIFECIGLDYEKTRINNIGEYSLVLDSYTIDSLFEKVPFMISMTLHDTFDIPTDSESKSDYIIPYIPKPSDEPMIGVIDTHFCFESYFHEWVKYENYCDDSIEIREEDRIHGTEVDSIIVDGPSLNPKLDDHCGRFRVLHIGATFHSKNSFATLKRIVEKAVLEHPEIHVWNLSLGSIWEINDNFISPFASFLDNLQAEYPGILFVVAGTNNDSIDGKVKKLGSPADSINSLVVNSVNSHHVPAKYSRSGPVLSFYIKPDVSYYGGDIGEPMNVVSTHGIVTGTGTSFAAPWISRKCAFLMDVMHLPREIVKSLIVHSTLSWDETHEFGKTFRKGYGVVPIRIDDILKTEDGEIRFLIQGNISDDSCYVYHLPVPKKKDKYPYYAKISMCYFPTTQVLQGVDYCDTELDLKFGRVRIDNGKPRIVSINGNKQAYQDELQPDEWKARKEFRKWDNTKVIEEIEKGRKIPRDSFDNDQWGIQIISNNRDNFHRTDIRFGLVVTLKEMQDNNYMDEFVRNCIAKGWIVERLNIEQYIQLNLEANQDISLE